MQPTMEKTTLVLAGAFNPAILTPAWVAKNALDQPEMGDFPVAVMAPISSIAQLPRFTFAGLSFSPSFQSLTFYLQGLDAAGSKKVCDVAARILQLLPHTPVTGLGFNFGFSENNPSEQLLRLLPASFPFSDSLGDEAEVVARVWGNRATWKQALVSVQCIIQGAQIDFDLNFHYGVQSASGAEAVLRQENIFGVHQEVATKIVTALNQETQE
jgi:hypothetical protein